MKVIALLRFRLVYIEQIPIFEWQSLKIIYRCGHIVVTFSQIINTCAPVG